ncbi:hypothetical protein [Microbacterium sp. P5_E9]
MTNARRHYERILRWYPRTWRVQHELVVLGTLLDMDDARGRNGPTFGEAWSLRLDGLKHRLFPATGEVARRRRTVTSVAAVVVILGCVSVGGLAAVASSSLAPSAEERTAQLAACLAEKGWAATIEADGVVFQAPMGQQEQYLADVESCASSTNLIPVAAPSREQLEKQYANLLAAQQCLEELGYGTPRAPSVSTFVASMGTWSPFAMLPNISAAEFAQIEEACPQPNLET